MQTKDLKEINNIFEDIRQAVNTAAGEEVITECDPRNSYAKKIARLSENEETLPFLFDAVVEDDNAETPDVSYHVNEEGTGVFSFRLSRGMAGSEGAPGKDGKDGRDGIDGINGEKGDKGDPGEDGKDGNRFKFIYLALPDTTIDVAAPIYNPDKDGNLPYFNGVQWTEEPSGVSIAKQIEYVSQSELTATGWSKWSYPAVWARWSKDGEPGKDGKDGIGRSIFIYTSTATIDSPETPQGGSWDPETNTITAPEGWFDNVPESREAYLWLSNAFFANDGITIESWSTPVRLTGENGKDGVDGKDIEFIYRLLPNRDTYSALRKYISNNPLTSGNDLEVPAVNDNLGIDSVWTNNPSGIDGGNYLIEVVCSRTKKDNIWSDWSLPTYWSMWGEDGMDGAGVEYIFRITSEEFTSDMLLAEFEQHDIYNHPDYQKDNFYPGGNWGVELDWTDEPSDVSETEPLEWVCLRKKINGVWGEFSEPKVWGKYAKDGYAFKTSYVFTRAISQPEQPHGGTYNEPYPTILGADGVTIQKDLTWSDTVPAGLGEIYMTYRTFYSGPEIVDEDWSTPVKMTDTAGFQVEYSTRIEKPAIGSLQPYYENYINGVDTREYEIVWREDNTAWSDDGTDAVWMATSVLKGGKWTDWSVVKVKGENGDAGKDGTSIEIKGTATEVFDALPDTLLIDEAGNEIHYVLFKDWIYKFNSETDTYEKFIAEEIGDGFVVNRNFWIWDGYRWYNAGEIKGADGDSAWFIVKFSDDKIEFTADNGTEPGRYIGMLFGVGAMDENYVNTASNYDWTLWSGDDGWGWEQIFLLTAKDSGYNEDNPPAIPTDNTKVLDHVPEGWTDTPSSVSANFPYCWSAKRKASRSEIEDWKGDPEKPGYASLYTRYAYDGITAFHLELTNDQIVVPVEKDGSIDADFTEASTRMILYSGDTVVEPTGENPILYTVSAGTVSDGDVTLTREDLKDVSEVTCKATYNGTDFYKTLHIIKTDTAYDITVNRAVLTRGEDGYFINGDKELIVNILRWNADHWYGIDNQGFNVSITHLDGTVDTDESYITVNGKATVTLSDEKDVRSIKIYFIKNGIEYFEEVGVIADGKQGPEGPQGPSGENGTSSFTFDLSNDNDTILTNSDGVALEELPSTTAKLYYGDEEIVAGIDYIVTVTGGTVDDGLNGVTELITTGGSRSFSFKTITDNKAVMTIKAVYGGISFVKEFTITRIVGTVDYNLKLSNYVVSRNETEGKFLTVIAEKVDHAEKSITFCMFNEDVKVVAKNNTETIELTEYLSPDQYVIPYSVVINYPIFVLSVDGVDWHTQEVAIVRDGVNGVKGDKGENVIVLSLTRVNGTFLYSETNWLDTANEFTSKIQVFDGLVDITNKCTYSYTASAGLDVSIENDIVTIKPGTISKETNIHEVVLNAHYGDINMSKTITVICTPSGRNGNTPYIKDGYWYIDGENTGIKAEGSNGFTPEIGDNGNWWLGGEDTGIPVTGIGVESVDVEYAINDSNTEAPTEGWVSEVTGSIDGKFVWSRTKTVYSNGSIDYSKAACISGKDGIGIQSVTEMYYLSTSATELTGGEWVNSYNPEFDDNLFIWTKTVIILSDGTRTETDPIRSSGLPGKDGKDGLNGADGVNGKDGVSIVWKGDFAEHLSNPENGWAYHNTTENASFVFFGQWYLMSKDGQNGLDGKDGKDGTSISIKGSLDSESELPIPPANASDCYLIGSDLYVWTGSEWKNAGQFKGDKGDPGKDGINGTDGKDGEGFVYIGNGSSWEEVASKYGVSTTPNNGWCYRDDDNGIIYVWDGNNWEIMIEDGANGVDGSNGLDGLSVFVTYNDNSVDSEPSKPTGDGNGNGWHTNATLNVNWMSQKVAAAATESEWGNPILICGTNGTDGETPVIYTLIASSNVVFYTSTGELIKPNAINLTVIKTIGTVATQVHNLTSEGLKLIINNGGSMSSQTNLVIGANTITDYARIYLCPSSATNANYSLNFKSYVEIEAVYNEKGENGKQGPSGPVLYPAGAFDSSKTYTGTSKKAPYVFFDSNNESDKGYYIAYGTPPQGNDPVDDLITDPDWSKIPANGGWVKMESYNAIYSDIGVFGHALVGKWVFYEDYMFSQLGTLDGVESDSYEEFYVYNWLPEGDDNYEPDTDGCFIPNIVMNARTGAAWFAGRSVKLGADKTVSINLIREIATSGVYSNTKLDLNGFSYNWHPASNLDEVVFEAGVDGVRFSKGSINRSAVDFNVDSTGLKITQYSGGVPFVPIQTNSSGCYIGDLSVTDGGLKYDSGGTKLDLIPSGLRIQHDSSYVAIGDEEQNAGVNVYCNPTKTGDPFDYVGVRVQNATEAFVAEQGVFSGLRPKVRKVSYSVTLDQFDHTVVASGSSTVLTLPSSPLQGQEYWLVCMDGNIQIKSSSTNIFNMYNAETKNQVGNTKRISWHFAYCDGTWYATPIFVAP